MEDDSNSRFGLADDDELAGFDMDGAIATSAKKNAAASSPSLFQHAVAPNTSSQNSNANGLSPSASSPIAAAIGAILDDFHNAASCGDYTRYFNHFTSDATFLGTDPHERWNISQFKEYAFPHFHKENGGWTYIPQPNGRHVTIAPCGTTAWFDETLCHVTFGECRGSGILVRPPRRLWSSTASPSTANTTTETAATNTSAGGGGSCHNNNNDSRWKIAQYNLTVPIPNDLLNNVASQIGDYHKMETQTNSTTLTTITITNDNNSTVHNGITEGGIPIQNDMLTKDAANHGDKAFNDDEGGWKMNPQAAVEGVLTKNEQNLDSDVTTDDIDSSDNSNDKNNNGVPSSLVVAMADTSGSNGGCKSEYYEKSDGDAPTIMASTNATEPMKEDEEEMEIHDDKDEALHTLSEAMHDNRAGDTHPSNSDVVVDDDDFLPNEEEESKFTIIADTKTSDVIITNKDEDQFLTARTSENDSDEELLSQTDNIGNHDVPLQIMAPLDLQSTINDSDGSETDVSKTQAFPVPKSMQDNTYHSEDDYDDDDDSTIDPEQIEVNDTSVFPKVLDDESLDKDDPDRDRHTLNDEATQNFPEMNSHNGVDDGNEEQINSNVAAVATLNPPTLTFKRTNLLKTCDEDEEADTSDNEATQMFPFPTRMDTQNEDEIYQDETQIFLPTNSPSISNLEVATPNKVNPAAITHADEKDNNVNLSSQSETPSNEELNDAMSLGTKNIGFGSPPKDDTQKIEKAEEIIKETVQSTADEVDPGQPLVVTDTISRQPFGTDDVDIPPEKEDAEPLKDTLDPLGDEKTRPSNIHEAMLVDGPESPPDNDKTDGADDDNKDPHMSQKSINSMTSSKSDLATPNNDRSTRRRSGGSSSEGRKENNDIIKVMFTGLVPTRQHKKMISDIGAQLVESIEDAATATRE